MCPGLLIPVTNFANSFLLLLSSKHRQGLFLLTSSSHSVLSGLQAFLSWGVFEGVNCPKVGEMAPRERWTKWSRAFTLLLWTQPSPEIEASPWAAVVNHKEYSLPYKDLIFEVQIAHPSFSINLYQEPKVVGMVMLILWRIYLQNR